MSSKDGLQEGFVEGCHNVCGECYWKWLKFHGPCGLVVGGGRTGGWG